MLNILFDRTWLSEVEYWMQFADIWVKFFGREIGAGTSHAALLSACSGECKLLVCEKQGQCLFNEWISCSSVKYTEKCCSSAAVFSILSL